MPCNKHLSGFLSIAFLAFLGLWLAWQVLARDRPHSVKSNPNAKPLQSKVRPKPVASIHLPPPMRARPVDSAPVRAKPLDGAPIKPRKKIPAEVEAKKIKPLMPTPQKKIVYQQIKPAPRQQERSQIRKLTKHQTSAVQIEQSRKAVREGRILLRILEHGSGPNIEIDWPMDPAMGEKLYTRLTGCYGMRIALMNQDGKLFVATGRRGQPWEINLDRYSSFVRQPTGRRTGGERMQARRIRDHHQMVLNAAPVRLFPRRVDALLLGNLHALSGEAYKTAKNVRAQYQLAGGKVTIEHIRVDGRPFQGSINLSGGGRRCGKTRMG